MHCGGRGPRLPAPVSAPGLTHWAAFPAHHHPHRVAAPPGTESSNDNGRLFSAAPGPLLLPTALIHIPSPAGPAGQVSEERKQRAGMGVWAAKGQQDVTILITARREVLLLPS